MDAVVGDHARRIDVVRTAAEQPWIAHMGKPWIAAANHHWFAESLDIWRYGVDLGAKGRSDEPGNILVPGKLAEGEHNSRVGRLVILYDKLNFSAEQTTCLVY